MNDEDATPIPPSEFIPVAEEIGLIEDIGIWILETSTREINELDVRSSVSVNLSAEQFKSSRLIDVVSSALKTSGLPPHRLEPEVTESVLLDPDTHTAFQTDKSFIRALEDSPEKSREIIDAIILLGDRMGMSVTAEGTETEAQRRTLVELGGGCVAGVLFRRAEPFQTVRAQSRFAAKRG